MAEYEELTGQQEIAKPEKTEAKPDKATKKNKESDGFHLPVLVEFTFTFSIAFLVFVFLAMAAVSWITGTTLKDFVLRTSASMLVLGGLLMTVSRQVSSGVLNARLTELGEMLQQPLDKETQAPEVSSDTETDDRPEA
jgi:hypothetical protein